ncbi:MAG: Lrp/AsnC family transcriptional regulator [Thermoplasmata archaeon]|nr:MAG: Lrp/AsnC family transcriptional regulator [Thermoplasmata archaeon]
MMAIARFLVPNNNSNGENNKLWDYVLENHFKWKNTGVNLLYMSQQKENNEVSLILDFNNSNAFGGFIAEYISPLKYVKSVWLFNLIQPRFFAIPKGTPMDYKRYVLTLTAKPEEYSNIYKKISELQETENLIITYFAYIFQGFEKDIHISVVAKDRASVDDYVNKNIQNMQGVTKIETLFINKTIKLVSNEDWKEFIRINSDHLAKTDDSDLEPYEYTEKFVCC